MEIITGYTGKPHVTAEQDRDVNEGIFDTGSFVLKTGSQLAAELVSNNEIKVRDGVLVIQGCTAVIKKNTYDPVTIANGSQGMKRIDLIVARYNKNEETKIEEVMLKVIQGTPNASTAAVPTYKTGDIQSGDLVADMPLYKVTLDGLNVTSVDKMFTVIPTLPELSSKMNSTIKEVKLVSKSCTTARTTGELGAYYGTIDLTDIPENCVAILPIGTTKTGTPGYPAILAPYKWELAHLKCRVWNVISSQGGEYGACFAYLLK